MEKWKEDLAASAASIVAFKARAEAEEAANEGRLAYEGELPPPPTLDRRLMARARFVFIRLHHRGFQHMQWHHPEIWPWAGSTPEGQAWFEKEVAAMEMLAEREERNVRLTRARILEEGFSLADGTLPKKRSRDQIVASVYAGDAAEDQSILEQIHEREWAEEKLRKAFDEGMSMKQKFRVLTGGKRKVAKSKKMSHT